MKIISDKVWNEHDQLIKRLMKENKQLKKDLSDLQNFCIRFANDNTKFGNAYNLDFPNTEERGLGDSGTPINLSDILEL